MFAATVNYGESTVKWYDVARKSKRNGSQVLRALAIILASRGLSFRYSLCLGRASLGLAGFRILNGAISHSQPREPASRPISFMVSLRVGSGHQTQLVIQGTLAN